METVEQDGRVHIEARRQQSFGLLTEPGVGSVRHRNDGPVELEHAPGISITN